METWLKHLGFPARNVKPPAHGLWPYFILDDDDDLDTAVHLEKEVKALISLLRLIRAEGGLLNGGWEGGSRSVGGASATKSIKGVILLNIY